MKRLLDPEHVGCLAELALGRPLLAFDFDGTLAPIVTRRDRAKMRPRTARLLARLCTLFPCAVITGRSRADVSERLGHVKVAYVVGNHGLEAGRRLPALERDVARAGAILGAALAGVPGLDLEDKRCSLAVHYRRARSKRAARDAIRRAASTLPVRLRVVPGKLVVNLVPAGAPNKGDALARVVRAARATNALYVGDDVTDEDVFEAAARGARSAGRRTRWVTVRVGRSSRSAAQYCLRDQHEIDTLLARLVELRSGDGRG